MTGTVEMAVTEIKRGKRYPVYLLHGDELLAKDGAKAIVGALVPPEQQSLSVEAVAEELDLASLPLRLNTLPLFSGTKVVVVQDSKAFVSKQNVGTLAKRSLEAWRSGDMDRALRLFLQVVATGGEDAGILDRAARGEVSDTAWDQLFAVERDGEADQWLREIAGRALADTVEIPEAPGAGVAGVYEGILQRGIPPETSLILTAEVIDQRRVLFKRISDMGFVIDCGVRAGKVGETQMNPDAARARIREVVREAGKTIDGEAVASIVNQTGFSVRALTSELEKILLYVGARPAVTTADVLAVLSNSREANIFVLTNAVSERDAGKALLAFRSLMTQREPVAPILAMLAGEVRNLIVARSALEGRLGGRFDSGMSFETFRSRILPRLAGETPGDDGSAAKLLEMNPFRAFNLLKGASRFPMQGLLQGLEAIHETDLSLKTMGHPEGLLMEQLLIRLCAGV